jgi:hypothetical protein
MICESVGGSDPRGEACHGSCEPSGFWAAPPAQNRGRSRPRRDPTLGILGVADLQICLDLTARFARYEAAASTKIAAARFTWHRRRYRGAHLVIFKRP